jgi:hypothetical protein
LKLVDKKRPQLEIADTIARLSLDSGACQDGIYETFTMGISRARKQGKQLGWPKRIFDREKARQLVKTMSIREAASQLGVSRGVIQRAIVD